MKTTRVKLLTARARTEGEPQQYGSVIDVPEAEARRMIDAQQAEPLTATKPARRNAAARTGRLPDRSAEESQTHATA